jgi:paraquat-inducible protein A
MAMKTNNLVACGECDALQREVPVPAGGSAECARCGAVLFRHKPASLDLTLAFVLAAAVVFVLANAYPLMGLDARGLRTSATIFDTARDLQRSGMPSVAVLVFVTVIAMPVVQLCGMLYLLVPLKLGFVPPRIHLAYRIAAWVQPWAMVEVYLLGVLVSLVRLTQVAKVDAGLGIYAVGAYVMLLAAALAAFEPRALWRRVEELGRPWPALQERSRA